MSTLGQRIRARRKECGFTQEELACKLGYKTKSSINKIELDLSDIPQSKIAAFAEALQTTPAYLMGIEEELVQLPDNVHPVKLKRFPMLGEISCGKPVYASEEYETFIDASADIKADFCLVAKGDSMIGARIHDGDVVFIRKQEIVDNGEIAAVVIENEATLKRWYYYREEKKLILLPENSTYEPLVFMGEDLQNIVCLGKAVCFISKL